MAPVLNSSTTMHDLEIVEVIRSGQTDSYQFLYERYAPAARAEARALTRNHADADDVVAEAFARVLDAIRSGGGPRDAFRAYLMRTVRNCAYLLSRARKKVTLVGEYDVIPASEVTQPAAVLEGAEERSLAAAAFAQLPERWQTILWLMELEGLTPLEIAPRLGVHPTAVSALAYRAREGLRQAYLQAHLSDRGGESCRDVASRMGAWVRGRLPSRGSTRVGTHLENCRSCRQQSVELVQVNASFQR